MAYNTERYGNPFNEGWMEWPGGLIDRMRTLHHYAHAMTLYRQHSGTSGWTKANPHILETVTQIWAWRKEAGYASWH